MGKDDLYSPLGSGDGSELLKTTKEKKKDLGSGTLTKCRP